MLGRGLQGSYNAFSSKRGIHFPRGEVVVFSVWYVDCIVSKLETSFLTWLGFATVVLKLCTLFLWLRIPSRGLTPIGQHHILCFFFCFCLIRFYNRINQAGQIPFECVRINKSLVRQNSFDIADLDTLIRRDVRSLPTAFHSLPS
jgi:hypothetical protein